jgi:hypothetical protein
VTAVPQCLEQIRHYIFITAFCGQYIMVSLNQNLYFSQAWFHLNGYISSKNNRHWSSINGTDFWNTLSWSEDQCVTCHYCYMNSRIQIFWTDFNSEKYASDILWPFLTALQKKKKHTVILCKTVLQHTANCYINVLSEVPEDGLIGCELGPARSPDLNPCGFYLWGNLKNTLYSNNPPTVDELKHSIWKTITSI